MGGGSSGNTISFTIESLLDDSSTYQAEDGMTWDDWVNSAYNTDGYYIDNYGYIITSAGTEEVSDVVSSDTILANSYYGLYPHRS